MLGSLIDTVLDRTILGGYSRLGYRVRERGWSTQPLPSMEGRVVLVTGATSGLGSAAAAGFAALGASVRMLVRDAERGERMRAQLSGAAGNGDIELVLLNLADLRAVRAGAEQVLERNPRIDVLVNNAGVLPAQRTESADGHELTFATNVLAPFLLTNLLLPRIRENTPGRVINVSSGGMYAQKLDVDALVAGPDPFDGTTAYARTKRAEVVLTELWAERELSGVSFAAMHPGWADTDGVKSSLPTFYKLTKPLLRTPEQGADTIVWLGAANEPAQTSGQFWHDRARRPTHLVPWTKESATESVRLWEVCERLTQTGASPAAR
jgi:dehydrogenase/reductase SDR family protein 12